MAETTHSSKELSPISGVSVNVKICSWTQFPYTQEFRLKWTKFCFPFSLDMCVLSTICSSGAWVQTYWMVLWTWLQPTWFILSHRRTASCLTEAHDCSHGLTESTRGPRPQLGQSQLPLSVYTLNNNDIALRGRSVYMPFCSTNRRRWLSMKPQM